MLIFIVGIAHAEAFVLHLAPPTPSKRHKRRITTNPLLTTRCFDQWRIGIPTEATMLAGNRFGFHAVVRHGFSLSVGMGLFGLALARQVHCGADRSILSDHVPLNPTPTRPRGCRPGGLRESQTMSQLSKVKHSRDQWKDKAKQRGEQQRYQRKQIARLSAERAQAQQALKETQTHLRQLESQMHAVAERLKVDVVWLSLHLFLKARISFRAVCRVLSLLASELGIKRTPCPQTVINWVIRLSIVRIEAARGLRGVPVAQAPFSNGLLWMIDLSIGLGSGKILAVLALDAHHHQRLGAAPSLEHVHCMGVSVAESWTGESIAALLDRLIAQLGRPAAYLKDGGSELQKAVDLLAARGLGSPCIDDISHAAASMLKRYYQHHPAFEHFLSACGRVSGKLKHTVLACLAPPTVRTKARFMNVHRLFTWAEQLLQLSPAGGAKAGSILARLRACLDELPACKALIKRFRGDAQGLLACQKILKTKGLCHDTLAQCEPLIATMPTAAVRQEFHAYLEVQLETAKTLGLDHVGLPISSDTIESLFGVAKHHGVGQTQDAARIALRLPALCGAPTREEVEQVLAVSVTRQHEFTTQCPSLTQQRREVLGHPERLEGLGRTPGSPPVELLPSPKKRPNDQEIITISTRCENPYGPQLACLHNALLIDNAAPPGLRETTLAL
jgi:hypothetical protein